MALFIIKPAGKNYSHSLGYVFVLSLLIYFLVALIRLVVDIIRKRK